MQSNNKVTPFATANSHFLESYNMPPPPPYSPTAPPVSPPTTGFPSTSMTSKPVPNNHPIPENSNMSKPPLQANPVLYPSLPLPPSDSTVYVTSTSLHGPVTAGPQAYPNAHIPNQFGGSAVVGSQHPQSAIPAVALTYAGELQMSSYRQRVVCPYCKVQVMTNTTHRIGMLNHLTAVAACWLALCCFVCVPYCIKGLKDVEHYCPICGRMLGVHRKLNF